MFDFGQNWSEFSQKALTAGKVQAAKEDFAELVRGMELAGGAFLDIGFGQGLSLLAAAETGARTAGNDINPKCRQVLLANAERFYPGVDVSGVPIVIGSILDEKVVNALKGHSPGGEGYGVVHSWGVLHHTGDMRRAIRNAVSLLREDGRLALAIYNRHWSSPMWWLVKWTYNHCPALVQRAMVYGLCPVIGAAKFLATGKTPSANGAA